MADDDNSIQVVDTSPYIYTSTFFFTLSALSSDLLFIRFSLMNGFLFLVLAAWSGYSKDGSFSTDHMPFVDGSIDITLIINTCLFILNFAICFRLVRDELPKGKLSEEEQALYRFFHCRCGLTRLEFDEIRRHGRFVELGPNKEVPLVECALYLVLEGVVECQTTFFEKEEDPSTFLKRSGQFFDLKLCNVFKLPIGFDSFKFTAKTVTRTKLFAWPINGMIAMRDGFSPALQPYWEYMIMRALAGSAIRHHLRDCDTLYDAWLIPEDPDWLEGAPSRDFGKRVLPEGNCTHLTRQIKVLYKSLWQIIPPKGIRHGRPSMVVKRNPKQEVIEVMAKAKQDCVDLLAQAKATNADVSFLSANLPLVPDNESGNLQKEEQPGEAADRFMREQSKVTEDGQEGRTSAESTVAVEP